MFNTEAHINEQYKNQTLLWHRGDSEEMFRYNKSDKRIQWCLTEHINYKFNSYGFRSDEFTNTDNLVSLGCSFTLGTGIPYESTWSYIISKKLNLANFNLAIDSTSADCCFRMAYNWIQQLKPKIVLYQSPDPSRLEWFDGESRKPHNMSASSHNHSNFYKEWIVDEKNLKFNHLKNLHAIQHLAESAGAKFVHLPLSNIARLDYARDTGHYGPSTNRAVAENILRSL